MYAPAYLLLHSSQIKAGKPSSNTFLVYGTSQKFLTDNGGEFANIEFLEMANHVHTTAAEAPWSNGVVERNTQTHMMNKITAETNTSPDLAQTWALNAKNIRQNVAAFSTFQLVLGTNPKLTATLSDDLPALSIKPSSQIVQENLNAIHSARAAFVASENSERIRRALLHNVRTSSEVHYRKCDPVQT